MTWALRAATAAAEVVGAVDFGIIAIFLACFWELGVVFVNGDACLRFLDFKGEADNVFVLFWITSVINDFPCCSCGGLLSLLVVFGLIVFLGVEVARFFMAAVG